MDESAPVAKQTTPALASPTGPGLQNTMMQARGGKLFDETPESVMLGSKIRSISGVNGATMVSNQLIGNSQFS